MADYKYNKKQTDFTNAALAELNPLYEMAIKQLKDAATQQKYASNDMAAARGFGQSGLAVDQLNKIDSATNSAVAQQNAQKIAEANRIGYDRYNNERNFDYGTWSDKQQQANWQKNYDYQVGRDKVSDGQWEKEYALRKKAGSPGGGRRPGRKPSGNPSGSPSNPQQTSLSNAYNQYNASRNASQPIDHYYKKQEDIFGYNRPQAYKPNDYANEWIKSPVDNPNLTTWEKIQMLKGGGYR